MRVVPRRSPSFVPGRSKAILFARSGMDDMAKAKDLEELRALRVTLLGKKSELVRALSELGALPAEKRREEGQRLNARKRELEAAFEARERELDTRGLATSLERDAVDVTLPGRPVPVGRHHPVTATIREVERIFSGMGFEVIEGPEVEWDRYNFE